MPTAIEALIANQERIRNEIAELRLAAAADNAIITSILRTMSNRQAAAREIERLADDTKMPAQLRARLLRLIELLGF